MQDQRLDYAQMDGFGRKRKAYSTKDIGEVADVQDGCLTVAFDDRLTVYDAQDLSEIETAYAYTIHKSQGSEFDVVILPLKYRRCPSLQGIFCIPP